MSTTRSMMDLTHYASEDFRKRFGFYLDALDKLYALQGDMGLEKGPLAALLEAEQRLYKTYLFLAESGNNTAMGVLRLLSGNFLADAYALIRVLYETACVMHFGNRSREHKDDVRTRLFDTGATGREQARSEWKLVKEAQDHWEREKPDLVPLRQLLNNYGSHLSLAKMVFGNVGTIGEGSAAGVFKANFGNPKFLAGLDMLHAALSMILEEWAIHVAAFGARDRVQDVRAHGKWFLSNVRPKLQGMQD